MISRECTLNRKIVVSLLPLRRNRKAHLSAAEVNPGNGTGTSTSADKLANKCMVSGVADFQPGWNRLSRHINSNIPSTLKRRRIKFFETKIICFDCGYYK